MPVKLRTSPIYQLLRICFLDFINYSICLLDFINYLHIEIPVWITIRDGVLTKWVIPDKTLNIICSRNSLQIHPKVSTRSQGIITLVTVTVGMGEDASVWLHKENNRSKVHELQQMGHAFNRDHRYVSHDELSTGLHRAL